jgi:3-oxoacyl-[acyl-carrier-protein] synthase II
MADAENARVVVTGLGVQTPLGMNPTELWSRLVAGDSAARPWADLEAYPVAVASRIPGDLGEPDPRRRGRALARAAARQAADSAALADQETRGGVGVFIGSTMGESAGYEAAAEGAPFVNSEYAGSAFAGEIAADLHLDGPQRTYGTACAAGNYAIGAAAAAVRSGEIDVALAGGVEPFSRIAMLGFARMRAMTPAHCRPFDTNRQGMQLGEGAAVLVLEREADAMARGAVPLAVVAGAGFSGDAFHPTKPRPDGSGMAQAMAAGLAAAGADPADVGWVSAHGTGTRASDAAEATALHQVFGSDPPPVSSIKGALGHSLGAATAVEAAVSVLALKHGVLPPNAKLETADADLQLDVVAAARPAGGLQMVMSCGFAFGGLNSALLLGQP